MSAATGILREDSGGELARFYRAARARGETLGPRHPRPRRGMLSRPSLGDVMAWRRHADAAMAARLRDDKFAARILLALHHSSSTRN